MLEFFDFDKNFFQIFACEDIKNSFLIDRRREQQFYFEKIAQIFGVKRDGEFIFEGFFNFDKKIWIFWYTKGGHFAREHWKEGTMV